MTICVKHWNELTKDELYDLLQLRIEVFVIEQNCPYQECDGLDKRAWHIFLTDESKLIGTARIYEKESGHYAIGRVVVSKSHRGGLGKMIMMECIKFLENRAEQISLSAQSHLESFYAEFGFESVGEGYLEDGIPHILMVR